MRMYSVVAFRYGTFDNVFPIGVFSSRDLACEAAKDHFLYRGGKYHHRIYEFETDKMNDDIGHLNNNLPCIEDPEPGHRKY